MRRNSPSAERSRGQHLPSKRGGDAANHSVPSRLKVAGQGGGEAPRICLGVITGAQGIRGWVRLKSFTAAPEAIADYGPLQDEAGAQRFDLALVGANKGVLIARIAGVTDRNAAERLKGVRLYVRRADLPAPDADEFYQADLLGLNAVARDGTSLGTVRAVYDFGAGASLEIADAAGKTMLVPFTTAVVPRIDIAAGKLVIAPPDGLFDAPKQAEKV